MITKLDAIRVGKALVEAGVREKANNNDSQDARQIVNGTLLYALDNLWYDIFTPKLREQFGNNRLNFVSKVWK